MESVSELKGLDAHSGWGVRFEILDGICFGDRSLFLGCGPDSENLWRQLDLLHPELNAEGKMVGFLNGLARGLP